MWDLIVSVPDHCLSFYFMNDTFFVKRLNYTAQNKKRHSNTNLVPFPSFRE